MQLGLGVIPINSNTYTDTVTACPSKKNVYSIKTRLKMKITSFWFVLCTQIQETNFLNKKDSTLVADTYYFVIIYHYNVSLPQCDCFVHLKKKKRYTVLFVLFCCLYFLSVCLCAQFRLCVLGFVYGPMAKIQ